MFFHIFSKGNNFCDFLSASLEDKAPTKWVYSEMNEFALKGGNSFFKECDPIEKGDKHKMGRVAFLESISIDGKAEDG